MSGMMKLFKKEPDPKKVVRESKQQLNKEVRNLDREVTALRREEEKLKRVHFASSSAPALVTARVSMHPLALVGVPCWRRLVAP